LPNSAAAFVSFERVDGQVHKIRREKEVNKRTGKGERAKKKKRRTRREKRKRRKSKVS